MFVKVNENAIVNSDHIVWIDSKKEVVLSDGTKHNISDDCSQKLFLDMQTVNAATSAMMNIR